MPSVITMTSLVSTTRTTIACGTCGKRTTVRCVSVKANTATNAVQSFTFPPSTTAKNAPCSRTRPLARRGCWTRRATSARRWSGSCKQRPHRWATPTSCTCSSFPHLEERKLRRRCDPVLDFLFLPSIFFLHSSSFWLRHERQKATFFWRGGGESRIMLFIMISISIKLFGPSPMHRHFTQCVPPE